MAYLSKRNPTAGVRFTLTGRDVEMLKTIERFRYIRTGQLHRLHFPKGSTLQGIRRRLKYLFHNRYVGRVEPFVQIGHGSAETAYHIGREGVKLLEELGVETTYYRKANQVKHQFLHHALDISEFRVHLELALRDHAVVQLHRFTADFELKARTDAAVGRRRYKLYDEIVHPVNKQSYTVYPDALIILRGKGEYAKFQKLYFLEVDRSTEGLRIIQDKVIGYNLYRRENVFKKFGAFDDFQVLFQAPSQKRAGNIRQALTDLEGTESVWVTSADQISEDSILGSAIWTDHTLAPQRLLKS